MPARLSTEYKTYVVVEYIRTGNCAEVVRRFRKKYPNVNSPSDKSIKTLYEKFLVTGSVHDDLAGKAGRPMEVHTEENIAQVQKYFRRAKASIRPCAAALGLSYYTVWSILHHDLDFKAYKIQMCQYLSEADYAYRMSFATTVLKRIHDGIIDPYKIWFTDECHFHLSGFVNKQNHRIWGMEKPYVPATRPLHPEYLSIWMGISGAGHTVPYFFDGTVTGQAYLKLLSEFAFPTLSNRNTIDGFYWQQDGATAHRTRDVKEFIRSTFNGRVIGLGFESEDGEEISWPARSPDLNPCDFAIWGFMKEEVYKQDPQNLQQLRVAISKACDKITEDMRKRIVLNFIKRLELLEKVEGRHLENVI